MANIKKFEKAKTLSKRSNHSIEKISIGVAGVKNFYRLVSTLNQELGHGNWTTLGRPIRHLRRIDKYNALVHYNRTYEVVFCVPKGCGFLSSKLSLIQ